MVRKTKQLAMTSTVSFKNSQGLLAQGTLVRLTRQKVVFEVYNPYSLVQLSEVITELKISQGDRDTYQGRAVVTGLLNTGLVLIVSASLVDPWSELRGLEPGPILRGFVREFVSDWDEASNSLCEPFRLAVSNLHNYLEELSRYLEHWETEAGVHDSDPNSHRQLDFVLDVDKEIEPKFTDLNGVFEDVTKEIPRAGLAVHRAFAQRQLHPLFMSSPFMNRAFNKPLGYAGDFEMVRMMLSEPWEGQNTFAKVVNAAALRHDAPAAHRNRIKMLHECLKRETQRALADPKNTLGRVNIMNLGCGPAVEIERFSEADEECGNVDFKLVDFNTETLDHVKQNLVPTVARSRDQCRIETEQRSVHEIIQMSMGDDPSAADPQANLQQLPQYDMVYCAGLFDYFRDTTCGFLIQLFYSWVKPGGMVLVTNVTPSHSSIAIMGLVLDWNLELRSAADMRTLAPELGVQTTYVDETNVNVFLEIRKPEAS